THTLFTRANQAVPNNYLAQCLLSGYLRDEKRIDDALAMSHEAAVTAPNSGGAHRQYALSLQVAGRRKEALHELRLAVQLNPTDFNVFNDIGGVLVEEGRDDQALEMFQRAVAMEPDFAMARHNLAVMLANKGRMDEAIAHWRVAEQLEPANGIVHGFLGEALRLRGDRRGAVTEYAAMWASKDHRPEWETNYAWLVATDPISSPEEIDLAVGAARDACTSAPADQKALAQDALAAALARAGQFNDAGAAAQQGVDLANAAGQPALAKAITARSALYRAGQPYFEQPKR
ncbi:MAG TPA: tetratricopeptide repeat protein, partial [Tepidisphaeraceae bacterium]|nr:tetratricopeptide repeat protein [Tepidisphaeraceae bacterium]